MNAPSTSPLGLLRCPTFWVAIAFLILCGWVYWPTLVLIVRTWWLEPEYSHGYVVLLFSLYLLYRNRERLRGSQPTVSWWGVVVILLAVSIYLAGAYLGIDYLNAVSLIPCCLGLALLLGGWPALRWSASASLFLLFLIPLPFRVAHALSGPLRGIATQTSGYALQTLGFPVLIEGYTLQLGDYPIAIAEACSGLSMLYVFIALAAAVALISKRPIFDRVLILLGAFPIAIIANTLRIILTAVAFTLAGREMGEFIFHDLAGWLMMPIALGLLYLELKLIDFVLIPVTTSENDDANIPHLRPLPVERGLPS
jgi:exosortase